VAYEVPELSLLSNQAQLVAYEVPSAYTIRPFGSSECTKTAQSFEDAQELVAKLPGRASDSESKTGEGEAVSHG